MVVEPIEIVKRIENKYGGRLSYLPNSTETKACLPLFEDADTGILFVYIPEGEYNMGFSDAEYTQIQRLSDCPNISIEEMQPVRKVIIEPFLLSITPILNVHILRYNKLFGKSVEKDGADYSPFFCEYELAESIANDLSTKIPNEEEWEYACRGRSQSLFCFGDSIPSNAELEKWLRWDLSSLTALNCNSFNLYGLFFGEWCSNDFTNTLAQDSDIVTGSKAVRGGGAMFWPWQDEEWVCCLSAFRMPSKDLLNNKAAFRLKLDI